MRQSLLHRARSAPHTPPQLFAALVLVAVLLVLRVPSLGAPLGIDEGGMTLIGIDWLHDLAHGTRGTSIYGDHWIDRPPLILGVYGTAQLLAGSLGVRLLGLLCAVLAACLTGTVASRLSSRRAWLPAALVSGALLSTPALDGDRTSGELLAAVPSALAIALFALVALRDERTRTGIGAGPAWRRDLALAGAGAAAAAAPLVKQSALDGIVAGGLWLTWRAWHELRGASPAQRRFLRDVAFVVLGGLAVAGITFGLALRAGASVDDLTYALFGFRVDVIEALGAQSRSASERFPRLLEPAAASGMLLGLLLAPAGIWLTRRGRGGTAGALLLTGWLAGAMFGVLGGGYYWAHYLLQLAAPIGAVAGIALAHVRARFTVALVIVLATSALTGQVIRSFDVPPARIVKAGYTPQSQQTVLAVGDFIRRNSSVDDRVAVLYARANVSYYAKREPATTYMWSSMFRAIPQARRDLLHTITGPQRAPWLVGWQDFDDYGMNADGAITVAITSGYREVAELCGKPVYVRSDRQLPVVVAPVEPCDLPGPQQVFGSAPVTRGFGSGRG